MHTLLPRKCHISAEISEYVFPPIQDMLVLGKDSPIGCIAMRRALELLVKAPYEHIEIPGDDSVGDILVRQALLRRIPKEPLIEFVLQHIKPLLNPEEILHVEVDARVVVHGETS